MKQLIGKKIKGFKFEDGTNDISYIIGDAGMDKYIGQIGVITKFYNDSNVLVKFSDTELIYPLPEALNHIVEELPQRGDEVLVWDGDESIAVKRIFLAYIEGANYPTFVVHDTDEENFKNGKPFATVKYKNYKTIPQKTKLTLQQIADKFGIDVNDLEVQR
jgi:hypothetical protein